MLRAAFICILLSNISASDKCELKVINALDGCWLLNHDAVLKRVCAPKWPFKKACQAKFEPGLVKNCGLWVCKKYHISVYHASALNLQRAKYPQGNKSSHIQH